MKRRSFLELSLLGSAALPAFGAGAAGVELKLAVFDCDATPAIGSELAYDPMLGVSPLSLRCRGVVLTGAGEPLVLAAVDWIGVANKGHDAFRDALAGAAGTSRDRVALHAVHQHDAPLCDLDVVEILVERGLDKGCFDESITLPLIERAAGALRESLSHARPVTHVGHGEAAVEQVASNRRVPGPDGKIKTRYTATKDAALRAEPEGVIDPMASVVSFWENDHPLAALSYYATHPQSYYRTGRADPDFPGVARFLRDQAVPGLMHVHFTGAAGNIGAGKYNDGTPANRPVLARRLADGLARAWENTRKEPLAAAGVDWRIDPVELPVAPHLQAETLEEEIARSGGRPVILNAAMRLAWLKRREAGHRIELSRLRLGSIALLHFPGELFVEYQLAAKKMRPDLKVALAAYGDYGPAYIGTTASYAEGGYETQPTSSFVSPEVEPILMDALKRLLEG